MTAPASTDHTVALDELADAMARLLLRRWLDRQARQPDKAAAASGKDAAAGGGR